jgi:TetR/AcrR family transcriptional regulator, cholesterol catabolism regulator
MEAQTKKEQLMFSAARLMRENGYQGTTMRDLAAAMDIEAASLYNHVASKEDILRELCFSMARSYTTAMEEVNDIYFNAVEKLGMAVRAHIRILTDNLDASYVFQHEWRHLNEPALSEFKEMRDKYEAHFRTILRHGEEEGVFNEVDNKFAVLTILASLNWVVEWYKPNGGMTPSQIADKLTQFILSGLRKETLHH